MRAARTWGPAPAGRPLRHWRWLALAAAVAVAACAPDEDATQAGTALRDAATRIEQDVRYLADDRLAGRAVGTPGYRLAAGHVAARMRALGLEPAGDAGGYLQQVPLLRSERLREGARFAIERDGVVHELAFASEFLPGHGDGRGSWSLRAPMLFVGHAVHAPELGHDDFAGVRVHGRIAVALAGAPPQFAAEARAFHAALREKQAAVAARGAVGLVIVGDPHSEARSPWARRAAGWRAPEWRLLGDDGAVVDAQPSLQALARVSAAAATRLFAGAPMDAAEVFAARSSGGLRAFELRGTALLSGRAHLQRIASHNVLGRVPGRGAPVLLSAHLDHLGEDGEGTGGDRIRNGAIDNALGVAVLLEAARSLGAAPAQRPIVFAALTAEEHGLLGALHLASHPAGGVAPVANLNVDMPVLLGPQRDVVAIGAGRSTLGPLVAGAAAAMGVGVSADPFPQQAAFLRSDQYAFVRAGVPALYLTGGVLGTGGDEGAPRAQLEDYLRRHYHRPGDDVSQPIHYPGAARLAALLAAAGRAVADAPEAPRWNAGDFLGERFGAATVSRDAGRGPVAGGAAPGDGTPGHTAPGDSAAGKTVPERD